MEPNLAVIADVGGVLRVEEVPEPQPAPDEAVITVAFGGICGSDLHYWRHGAAGESILRAPMVLGHELSGTVLAGAADGSGPAVGTPVTVHPATPGRPDFRYPPDKPNLSGGTYLGSAARFPHTDGGFARRIALPTRMLRDLPPSLSLADAALAEPAAVAWHALSRAGRLCDKRVLVIGSGPIGALIVAAARREGAREIIAVDLHEQPLEIAARVGATRTLRATDADAIAGVDADVVFESSGNPRGLASAISAATRGGQIVMVGLIPAGEQPALLATAITRELRLVGSFRFNDEIDEVIAALADHSLVVGPVVTHTFPVADAVTAFEIAADPRLSGKVLLDFA
ncbi:MAG: L-idonate 5-dehydrogenase [Microbacterium sp.]|nr:L-idonate 5-dehydrogenase [Microbacterium sp.]